MSRHLGKLDQRRLPFAGQWLASGEQLFDVAGRGTRPGEVETLRRRQLQKTEQGPSLVGNPIVQRVVRRPVAQDVRRRAVAGELQGRAKREAAVGLELDRPAAQDLDALQEAQSARAKVFHW